MELENDLIMPGRLSVCGSAADLRPVGVPIDVLATRKDHIVPWRAAYRTTQVVGGCCQFVLGASGLPPWRGRDQRLNSL